jgi:hypothetical protein
MMSECKENNSVFAAQQLVGNHVVSGKKAMGNGLIRSVRAEFIKLRHSSMWLAVVVIPVIGVLIGTGNYWINADALHGDPWFELWTQVALFYGYFFYPLLVAVIAGYMWRVEHFEHNWNGLMTSPVSPSSVWFAKFIVLFLMALLCQCLNILFYWLSGNLILHLSGQMPSYFWWWLIGGTLCVMASGAVQMYLSMRIRSFAVPVGISFGMCIAGLGCYAQGWWLFPNTLAIIGINAQHEGLPALPEMAKALGGTVFWVILISILGILYLKKSDIKSAD